MGDNLPDFLKRVLILCGQRVILFDNKTKDEEKTKKQVHELLKLIDQVREQNHNIPYTDEMYYKIKEENDRHKRKQEELESKGHAEEKFEALMKELQLTNERNLKAMAEMLEKNMRLANEAQQKLFEKREKEQELNQREKIEMKEIIKKMEGRMREQMEAQLRRIQGCNIL